LPDNNCKPDRHEAAITRQRHQQFEFRKFSPPYTLKSFSFASKNNLHLRQMEFFEIHFYKKTKPASHSNVLAKFWESALA